jgi:hypothetical protein
VRELGEDYEAYRRSVPMIVPFTGKRKLDPVVKEEPFHAEFEPKI